MWKIRHWTMIGLSSGLRLGLTVEAKALKHRKIQKSLFPSFPPPPSLTRMRTRKNTAGLRDSTGLPRGRREKCLELLMARFYASIAR